MNPSLVLVQPRKTLPYITERLLMRHKESNQTNKHTLQRVINKGADQTVDAQAGLSLCSLYATKSGFLTLRPTWYLGWEFNEKKSIFVEIVYTGRLVWSMIQLKRFWYSIHRLEVKA